MVGHLSVKGIFYLVHTEYSPEVTYYTPGKGHLLDLVESGCTVDVPTWYVPDQKFNNSRDISK